MKTSPKECTQNRFKQVNLTPKNYGDLAHVVIVPCPAKSWFVDRCQQIDNPTYAIFA